MFLHKDTLSTMTEIKRDFTFSNDSLSMYPLLNEIISCLKIHLPSEHYDFKISNCKQILIELLTNAIKHSNTDITIISICINDASIEITKSDKGRKFYLNNYTGWPPLSWPLDKKHIGDTHCISARSARLDKMFDSVTCLLAAYAARADATG